MWTWRVRLGKPLRWLVSSDRPLRNAAAPARVHFAQHLGAGSRGEVDLATSCDYAVRGLLCLAQRDDPFEPVLLRVISPRADAPEADLPKIFHGLPACNVGLSH